MIICCPHCAFSRTVEDSKIPPAAQTATCPKCRHKFRFRELGDAAGEAHRDGGAGHVSGQISNQEGPLAAGPEFEAGAPGRMDGSHDAEHGEDIWDRVASLGESWAEDDPDFGAPAGGAFKSDTAWDDGYASSTDVPWEHIRDIGLPKAFGQTALQVLLKPGRFFSGLGVPRKLGLAVVFYLVVTALQTYMFQAWMQLFPESSLGVAGSANALFHGSGLYIILTAPLIWVLFLVAVTALSVLALRLISGKTAPLVAVMRILAYSSAPMLLGVVPFIGAAIGQIWAMLLFLFGCKYAFRLKFFAAAVVLLPVYLCLAVLRIILSGSF